MVSANPNLLEPSVESVLVDDHLIASPTEESTVLVHDDLLLRNELPLNNKLLLDRNEVLLHKKRLNELLLAKAKSTGVDSSGYKQKTNRDRKEWNDSLHFDLTECLPDRRSGMRKSPLLATHHRGASACRLRVSRDPQSSIVAP